MSLRLVADSSVLIDLHAGSCLADTFTLPHRFAEPDVILAELVSPPSAMLLHMGLETIMLSGESIGELVRLRETYSAPSTNDLLALVAARQEGSILVTSDHHLRAAAEAEGVSVHGTLWILDELVRLRILETSEAAKSLEAMMRRGSRLPQDECQKRLAIWVSNCR